MSVLVDTRSRLDEVADGLQRFFAEREQLFPDDEPFAALWRETAAASTGGKLLRPRLVLLAHDAYAQPNSEAVRLGAAFELLHTALLLHDDVIDGDLRRRGEPNLIARRAATAVDAGVHPVRAREYGQACAILAGDVLLSGALRLVAELDAPAGVRRALVAVFDDALADTAIGEHADVHAGLVGGVDATAIAAIMERKTARYSFCAPLAAGAILGGAPDADVHALTAIGGHLGVAFQACDDDLGVFGDEASTGKSALSDLREGKETLLIAFAREHRLWSTVAPSFGDPELTAADAAALRDVIERTGARRRLRAFAEQAAERAAAAVRSAGLPADFTRDLCEVADTLTGRDR